MRVLVLGASGMLGSAIFKVFTRDPAFTVWGTVRNRDVLRHFREEQRASLRVSADVLDPDALISTLADMRPDVVINCVGVIKQMAEAKNPLVVLPINAVFPHRLALLCGLVGARLIQGSTDCVFSGKTGDYLENDPSDAEDLYGKSKHLGEVHNLSHVITIRTSIIGHELNSNYQLVEWFLAQRGKVRGFTRAIFSGLPTVELARVMKEYVLPRPDLSGLYHVAAEPISKHDLLRLVARRYGREIAISPDDSVVIDRSLNGARFRQATGYVAPAWPELVDLMYITR